MSGNSEFREQIWGWGQEMGGIWWAMLQNQSFGAVPAGEPGWEGQGPDPQRSAPAVWLPQQQPPPPGTLDPWLLPRLPAPTPISGGVL